MNPLFLLTAIPWFAWIPIVAIIGAAVNQALSAHHRHCERMAMIERGIHPDDPASLAPGEALATRGFKAPDPEI